ncbi:toxin-antitoxin system YwqK family antitoxin [Spirosoma jeollabukense]
MEYIIIIPQQTRLTSTEMAIMAQQGPGLSKLLLWLLAGMCSACQQPAESLNYIDASHTQIQTQEGINYIQDRPILGSLFSIDVQGDTVFIIPFVEGKENGRATFFYPKKRLREERFFVNGWKEGTHRGWYENGKAMFEYHFHNDMFEGSYKEWFPNGKLFRNMNYEKGQESGIQQSWYTTGKIKMNYIIKDDRRYGLLGTKNCKNVSDNIF